MLLCHRNVSQEAASFIDDIETGLSTARDSQLIGESKINDTLAVDAAARKDATMVSSLESGSTCTTKLSFSLD